MEGEHVDPKRFTRAFLGDFMPVDNCKWVISATWLNKSETTEAPTSYRLSSVSSHNVRNQTC